MKFDFCPGSSRFKQPEPEIIKCPSCSEEIEIWTDEVQVVCPKCKKNIIRETGASCLDWCKYAKECVGEQTFSNYMKNKAITIKQKLLVELEKHFGEDKKRINHAQKVMEYAEEILMREGGDWHIVIPASILHDVGIKIAEEKYGSSAGHYQEKEGPEIAQKILFRLGFKKEDIEEICQIIAHHHSPGKIDTENFKILYDSDWLVNLKDEVDLEDKTKLKKIIEGVFLTNTAKKLAERIYLGKD